VSQGAVMLSSRICRLASTLLVGMSCSSSNLCSAHALLGPLRRTSPCVLAVLLWRSSWVTGTAGSRGLAVPVAFTLHVPVQRDGECEYETMAASCRTKETSMLALGLEMLLKEVFFRDASENLARALGIAGGVFDTARWPDAVIAQATCDVRHT